MRTSEYRSTKWLGMKFGQRTVVGIHKVGRFICWDMMCLCGNIKTTPASGIKRGRGQCCIKCQQKNQTGSKHPYWRGSRHMPMTMFNKWKRSAIRRNMEWSLTIEYLDNLIDQQEWKCKFTGHALALDFGQKNGVKNGNASLDRIDSSKGYIEGNIQFVLKSINMAKQAMPDENFVELCIAVVNNYL